MAREYKFQQALTSAQPAAIQHDLDEQGKRIVEAIVEGKPQVCFSLPDQIVCMDQNLYRPTLETIPEGKRQYSTGNYFNRLRKIDLQEGLHLTLNRLEQSHDRAISTAAGLLRYSTVMNIVYNSLPDGRSLLNKFADEVEMISAVPEEATKGTSSVTSFAAGAIVEKLKMKVDCKENLGSFVPYASRFFLPQWVAFDGNCDLLVNSVEEADTRIRSMQSFMELLILAEALAPYIYSDKEFMRKRCGMLTQLVNQGQALAIFHTREFITYIKQRVASGSLNRGLSLSLPYFNDQELCIDFRRIEIIPSGKVLFVPAFVVLAVRQEALKVSRDLHLNSSTRKHLLNLLESIEQAFEIS
jgi:hypothetical protein